MKQNIFDRIVLKQILIMCNVFVSFTSNSQQPSITCPGNQKVQLTGNSCTVIVNNIDPVISPVSTTGQSGFGSASGKAFPIGTSTVAYTLTSDPTITCSFTVTVEDKIPPVITCPSNITVKCPAEIPLPEDIIVVDPCSPSGYATAMFVSDVKSNEICSNKFTLKKQSQL